MSGYQAIWREPREESVDIYPGLTVHDGRHSGSITLGRSRLPLLCVLVEAIDGRWTAASSAYDADKVSDWTDRDLVEFVGNLLEMRGEFARLLLELAEAERLDDRRAERNSKGSDRPWWEHRKSRRAVLKQLRRCAEALEAIEAAQ